MKYIALLSLFALSASGVYAQDAPAATSQTTSSATIEQLLEQGFEVKAAVPNGTKFIVFLQKEKSAFACEFASLATSQCGALK